MSPEPMRSSRRRFDVVMTLLLRRVSTGNVRWRIPKYFIFLFYRKFLDNLNYATPNERFMILLC